MTGITPSLTEHSSVRRFKSSYSGGEGNECVEAADLCPRLVVRDSKTPQRGINTFSSRALQQSQTMTHGLRSITHS